MIETLTTHEIADRLYRDENAGWSYRGALALAEWLESMEEDTGNQIEFDRVAIRCDFSEHESLTEWLTDYTGKSDLRLALDYISADPDDEEEEAEAIRSYITDNGTLIEFEGGIIVSSF